MNDTQLLDRLASTDRHPISQPLPGNWSPETVLGEMNRRLGSAGYAPAYEPRRTRAGWLAAAAAFGLVVVLGATVGVLANRTQSFATTDALATADAYFAAFNRGDSEAAEALFLPDAPIAIKAGIWGAGTVNFNDEWARWLEWHTAQGSQISNAQCRPTDETETSVTVACGYGMADVVRLAVGVTPTLVTATMVITPTGISRFESTVIDVPAPRLFSHYHAWVVRNYPEDAEPARALGWDSVEEARISGQIRASHAYGWAEFLEERDCAYPSWCFFRTPVSGGD